MINNTIFIFFKNLGEDSRWCRTREANMHCGHLGICYYSEFFNWVTDTRWKIWGFRNFGSLSPRSIFQIQSPDTHAFLRFSQFLDICCLEFPLVSICQVLISPQSLVLSGKPCLQSWAALKKQNLFQLLMFQHHIYIWISASEEVKMQVFYVNYFFKNVGNGYRNSWYSSPCVRGVTGS